MVALIKPQFEVGVERLGKGGLVKHQTDRQFAIDRVVANIADLNMKIVDTFESPIAGGDGNREYLAWIQHTPAECN